MIIECLDELVNSDLDFGVLRKDRIKYYINNFNEEQLSFILSNNGLVAHDIFIYFYPGIGFRCLNDDRVTGKLPICNILQNRLNKKYQELL